MKIEDAGLDEVFCDGCDEPIKQWIKRKNHRYCYRCWEEIMAQVADDHNKNRRPPVI